MQVCASFDSSLVRFIAGCDDLIDLYLVVDSSESIIQDDPYGQPLLHWTHIKQFLRGVVGNLPVGPRRCKTGGWNGLGGVGLPSPGKGERAGWGSSERGCGVLLGIV